MGKDEVYWTKHETRYHLFEDCQHINHEVTEEIFKGGVADAYEHKNIKEMCKTCENRAVKLLGDDVQVPEDDAEDVDEEEDDDN